MLVNEKVIVFGASENGKSACDYLSKNNDVLFVCDNDAQKWGTTVGRYKVESPEYIEEYPGVVVVLAVVFRYHEVVVQLRDMGVENILHFAEYINLVTGELEQRIRRIPRSFPYSYKSINKICGISRVHLQSQGEKKVLLFANLFPPMSGSGVQRPLKFAKYLKKFGYKPIVVTRGCCGKVGFFDYDLLDEINGIEIIRIQDELMYPEEMDIEDYSMLCGLLEALGLDEDWIKEYDKCLNSEWMPIPDMDVLWVIHCMRHIAEYVDLNGISLVYTTVGPYSSALFGAYMKIKYDIKWILDYRDPWTLDDFNMDTFYRDRVHRREFEKKMETSLLNTTDYVIATSEKFCEEFRKCCPDIKTTCITNGYDEEDFTKIDLNGKNKDFFSIVFNGCLVPSYDIKAILSVINELIGENMIDRTKIRLVFNGSNPAETDGFLDLDEFRIVRYNGYLTHDESIKEICQADLLLLFGHFGDGAYSIYTGKVFEYLRTGKPILSISSPYGVQYELVEKNGHGITATPQERDKIKNFIFDNYSNIDNEGSIILGDNVEQFSRENLTEKLAKVFDEVI